MMPDKAIIRAEADKYNTYAVLISSVHCCLPKLAYEVEDSCSVAYLPTMNSFVSA